MADDVSVKISAQTAGFEAAMRQAAATANQTFAQMKVSVNGAKMALDDFGETARRQIAAAMGQAGAVAKTAGTEVQTATAGMSRGLASAALNTGELREAFVLLHETITGRLNRIPGSLLVLAERFGSLDVIIGALTSTWTGLGVAAAGTLAAFGSLAYQAVEDAQNLNQVHDTLTLMGRGLEVTTDDIAKFRSELRSAFDLSASDARRLTAAFAGLPQVTLAEAQALANLTVEMARARGIGLDEAIRQVSEAAQRGGTALLDMADKLGINTGKARENVEALDKTKETSAALSAAVRAVSAAVESQVGAWARGTAAAKSYMEAVGALGEAGVALAVGGALGPSKAPPPPHPPATGPAQSVEAVRKAQEDAAKAADEHKAAIINLRTAIANINAHSIAGLQKRIELTKQLAQLEYPGTTATAAAERNALIAAAERREAAASGRGGSGRSATNRAYQDFAAAEREKITAAEGSASQIQAIYQEWAARAKATFGEQSSQYQNVLREMTAAAQRAAREQQRAQAEAVRRDYEVFSASEREKIASAHGSTAQILAIYREWANQAAALFTQNSVQYQTVLREMTAAAQRAAEESQRAWQRSVQQISDQFASAATDIITRTKSIKSAFDDLVSSLIKDTLQSAFKSLLVGSGGSGGLGGGLSNLLFGSQGLSGLLGLGAGGLLGGLAGKLGGTAGGGLLGGLFGWLFGGGAAAGGTSAGLEALGVAAAPLGFAHGGIVPSAAGGWSVPQLGSGGILAQLHSREMVLPPDLSDFVRNAAGGAGGGGAGIGAVNFNVTAMDSQSVAGFFRSNGAILVAALNQAMRNGSALRVPG